MVQIKRVQRLRPYWYLFILHFDLLSLFWVCQFFLSLLIWIFNSYFNRFLTLDRIFGFFWPFSGRFNWFLEILDRISASFLEFIENHSCSWCLYLKTPGSSCNSIRKLLDHFDKTLAFLSWKKAYLYRNSWVFSFSLSALMLAHSQIKK